MHRVLEANKYSSRPLAPLRELMLNEIRQRLLKISSRFYQISKYQDYCSQRSFV